MELDATQKPQLIKKKKKVRVYVNLSTYSGTTDIYVSKYSIFRVYNT